MYPEDSGSGLALDSRNRWATVFFPGDLTEIEAEPEQVERPGSTSPGKEAGKGLGDPSQGGANPVLEVKPRNVEWLWH